MVRKQIRVTKPIRTESNGKQHYRLFVVGVGIVWLVFEPTTERIITVFHPAHGRRLAQQYGF